jgi:A/G-specific adenine glycosylase
MLQQTQVPRVLIKYPEFIEAFPDFHQLNKATLAQVLAVWQGMGYNRRAKYLKLITQRVIREFAGNLPLDPQILQAFPGIGKATAASVVVFAANQPIAFIETNVRRVYLYHFFPKKQNVSDQKVLQLVEATLDRDNPREWYYALMDYGTTLSKTGPNPNRRSQHYTKQSPFTGSLRQVRGEILRILLASHGLTRNQLKKKITGNKVHFEKALEELERERMVERKRGKITLASRL